MTVTIYTHPRCLQHDAGPGHPESPARLRTVMEALAAPPFAALPRRQAVHALRSQVARVHSRDLLDLVLDPYAPPCRPLDPDTWMSEHSAEAALLAAGAVVAAVDAAIDDPRQRAFCAVRPPGHHASHDAAMGFCLFNNVAIGAAHALDRGLSRVAIVDFDVHHGNGTQDIFWREQRVMYASSHEDALYPDSGHRDETGVGNIVNMPLVAGSGAAAFQAAWEIRGLPALDAFRPELVLVSAGFDGHRLDPMADLNLDAADFAWLTLRLVELAERHAGGRIVSCLEGGYSLPALRESVQAHVAVLAGMDPA